MADDLLTVAEPSGYDASSIEVLEGLEPVRKRPGMYIGGTDERALHHMVAEILDNSMDEAVAGFANRIEVELHEDYALTVRDNGRGIPIDPHPKFPGKSALEVILCTLHAGGKFSGKAYQTSGGLHGVGASVVNALSDSMVVQVARDRQAFEQRFSRGHPLGGVEKIGAATNWKGTRVTFHADEEIFGKHRFKPARLLKMVRSKAYLFSGVEIRWKSAIDDGETATEATFHFPGGLADKLRVADEDRDEGAAAGDQVVAGDLGGFAVVGEFPVSADAFEDGGPEAAFVGAAFGGRDGVTIRLDEAVARWGPVDGPFDFAGFAELLLKVDKACEGFFGVGGGFA